ncbi:hypothetical protein GQ464_007485 [Rhodocaloribacter litoris]|uniref:hypothetical protein n=1 Tax=Rhodocaloribacter litoris TaxID=2558931 RepID=UPI0014215FB1|nr:hypothetical protein [Rhodocaloribacter litoris]QXD16770.1 hypothetical protein GQ464_007485 [Rhodocaloribacter litoris]
MSIDRIHDGSSYAPWFYCIPALWSFHLLARPAPDRFARHGYDLYYRLRAAVPF